MRMVRLSELDAGHGTLTAWRLSGTASAPLSPAPPAHNQELRLQQAAYERAEQGNWSRRWHLTAFHLDGPLAPGPLEDALADFVRRHSTLRSRFSAEGDTFVRHVMPPAAVSLSRLDLGVCPDSEAARAALVHLADEGTDPLGRYPCVFAALSGPHGTTVFMAADHLHVDMHSHVVAVEEIHRLYEARLRGTDAGLPVPGDHVEFALAERARDADDVDAALAHWVAFARAAGDRLPTFPLDLGVAPGEDVPLTQELLPLFDEETADAVESWCWANGGMFLPGLLAAAALTVVELGGSGAFRTIIPMQTRPDPKAPAVGWYVNGVPIAFDVPEGAGLDLVVRRAQAAFLEVRRLRDAPIERIQRLMPSDIRQDRASWFSYLDLRGGRGPWDPRRQARVTSSARNGGGGDVWINRTPDGTVLQARYPDVPAARAAMRAYRAGIARHLTAAVGR